MWALVELRCYYSVLASCYCQEPETKEKKKEGKPAVSSPLCCRDTGLGVRRIALRLEAIAVTSNILAPSSAARSPDRSVLVTNMRTGFLKKNLPPRKNKFSALMGSDDEDDDED